MRKVRRPGTADDFDWARLDRLRATFLGRERGPDYWTDREDLAQYDLTFAQRIAWKWDAVLAELADRGWQPPRGPLLDWGCGSGIAGRRVVAAYGPSWFGTLTVSDRSAAAEGFAAERAVAAFPDLTVERGKPGEPAATVVVSHVVNELDEAGLTELRTVMARAQAVLWVEPGTADDSRALIAERERLLPDFAVVAPCLHRAPCGLLAAGNEPHWCHHFAEPPPGVLGDPEWTAFARRAGIDLRATPYSFLVLDRRGAPEVGPGWTRILGRPRIYKGFAAVLECDRDGVREGRLQRRDHRALLKAFEKERGPRLLHGEAGPTGWKMVDSVR